MSEIQEVARVLFGAPSDTYALVYRKTPSSSSGASYSVRPCLVASFPLFEGPDGLEESLCAGLVGNLPSDHRGSGALLLGFRFLTLTQAFGALYSENPGGACGSRPRGETTLRAPDQLNITGP